MPTWVWADPLDQGEAYTTRQEPPDWMNGVDFTWLIVDYGLFALSIIALSWLVFKHPERYEEVETVLFSPYRFVFAAASRSGMFLGVVLQCFGALMVLATIATAMFFCQWLMSPGLGALAMTGLAWIALILVRVIKGNEKEQLV